MLIGVEDEKLPNLYLSAYSVKCTVGVIIGQPQNLVDKQIRTARGEPGEMLLLLLALA